MALQGSSGLSYTLLWSSSLIHDARLPRLEECRVRYRGLVGRGRVRRLLERAAIHLSSILLWVRIQLCPRGRPQRTRRRLPPCRSPRVSPRPLHSLLLHLLLSSSSCSFRRWFISFFTIPSPGRGRARPQHRLRFERTSLQRRRRRHRLTRLKLELGWHLRQLLPPLEKIGRQRTRTIYRIHPIQ